MKDSPVGLVHILIFPTGERVPLLAMHLV